jgi:hypothetical protein
MDADGKSCAGSFWSLDVGYGIVATAPLPNNDIFFIDDGQIYKYS